MGTMKCVPLRETCAHFSRVGKTNSIEDMEEFWGAENIMKRERITYSSLETEAKINHDGPSRPSVLVRFV